MVALEQDIEHEAVNVVTLSRCLDCLPTTFEHYALLCDFLNHRDFDNARAPGLLRFLFTWLRSGDDRLTVLFDLRVDRLVRRELALSRASRLVCLITGV